MDISMSNMVLDKQMFKLKAPQKDGLILQIHNTPTELEAMNQRIRYTQLTFDTMGHVMAAINQKGDVLIVDFVSNKFWTFPTNHNSTVIKFSPLNDSEILMGGSDGSIQIINIETSKITGTLNSHKESIQGLSFSKEYYCLSYAMSEAIIWNLRTNLELQNLNLSENTLLKLISFMPVTNNILACFQDDTMQVWTSDDFRSYRKILPSTWNKSTVKCIAITKNGRAMIVGGHNSYLAIFLLDIWEYTKTIGLPEYIQSVKSLEFISEPFDGGSNRILAILSGNGVIYFWNMEQNFVVNKLLAVQEILRFNISNDGKYLGCVLSTGEINMYVLNKYITSEIYDSKKRKVVKSNQRRGNNNGNGNKSSNKKNIQKNITTVQKELEEILDYDKLHNILKQYWEYPSEHRLKIWTHLLQLPHNLEEYKVIHQNPVKTPFDNLDRNYPLENKNSIKNLKRSLINICTWSPFFTNVDYLPVFIFPFVHSFQNEPILCFEAVATILINWCQHWFEYYPMPPINVLAMLENVMLEHDVALLRHLNDQKVTPEIYAWSLLEAAFTETLMPKDWKILFDHIFSNEPAFILLVAVSYNLVNRHKLLTFNSLEEFNFFYHNQNPISVHKLLKKSYNLLKHTSEKNHPRQYLNGFRSIAGESYPMFSGFPKTVLELQNREMDELTMEDDALKHEIDEINKLKERRSEEFEFLRITEVEKGRVKELEEFCKQKIKTECERIQSQRQYLAQLRKQLTEEEVAMLEYNSNRLKANTVLNKRVALEKMLKAVDESRMNDDLEVMKAETELLRHYSDLLMNRIQIEGLLADKSALKDNMEEQIKVHQMTLLDELGKIKNLVDSKEYLKQLSLATGLRAMDNLIQRVEDEILRTNLHRKSGHARNGKWMVSKLQAESLDLELRVKDLLGMIETHKKMCTMQPPTFTDQLISEVANAKSLTNLHHQGHGDLL